MTNRPTNTFSAYHAHVYFDQETVNHARSICEQAGELFAVKVGRVHQNLVGPHPRWSCQLAFSDQQFDQLIPWLDANRNELTVFVHPETGNHLADHSDHATWLGEEVELDLSMFQSADFS